MTIDSLQYVMGPSIGRVSRQVVIAKCKLEKLATFHRCDTSNNITLLCTHTCLLQRPTDTRS